MCEKTNPINNQEKEIEKTSTSEYKFKVMIDVCSFKENPDYGKSQTLKIPGITHYTIKYKDKDPEPLSTKDYEEIVKKVQSLKEENKIKEFFLTSNIESINAARQIQEAQTLPDDRVYLYTHFKTEVQCKHCGGVFLDRELIVTDSDSVDDDGEYEEILQCPKCNRFNPCEVEYETEREFLEKNKKSI